METDLRSYQDIIIVDLRDRLVAGEATESLRQIMIKLIEEDHHKKVLLNLSDVGWMDSSGIGELMAGIRRANQHGADVKLLRIGDRVKHVLSISRLLPLLDVYEEERQALESFGSHDGE